MRYPLVRRVPRLTVLLALVAATIGVSAAAQSASAAPSGDHVLVLASTVSGGSASIEASEAASKGMTVDVVDAATWSGMTAADFSSYRAIILGDPTCSSDTGAIAAATADAKTWGGVVNGNVVIIGSDPVYHAGQGGETLTRRAVDFAISQVGKTGVYITLSCYYHDTGPKTAVPLLDGIGGGGFTVTGVGCYNSAHIVAESPALTGLSDSTLSNWSCSVHEAFQTWSGGLVPLTIARDFDSSYTASDGSQGPPYILAGGNIKSFPLSLTPLASTSATGTSQTVTAQLLDGTTRAPVPAAKLVFQVVSGPDAGVSGLCSPGLPFVCLTQNNGQVSWTYQNKGGTGTDTIRVFYDRNGNGSADAGEPQTTSGATWTRPAVCSLGAWPGSSNPLPISYQYGGGHRYLGNVAEGAANWSKTGTRVQVIPWPGVPYALQVPTRDVSTNATWWGLTSYQTNGLTMTSANIAFNQRTVDPLSKFMRTKVATHELGHALGMAHPEDCGVGPASKSIMHQGLLAYNVPQGYDTNILSELYR